MTVWPATTRLSRRHLLKHGTLFMAGSSLAMSQLPRIARGEEKPQRIARLGIVTDSHFADRETSGTRHYRESLTKMKEAVSRFTEAKIQLAVELGDFIDAAPTVKEEIGYLKSIEKVFAGCQVPRHYVLGNHCVYTLTKQEFLAQVPQKKSYYSTDFGDLHLVVLDACFRADGVDYQRQNYDWTDSNIPREELEWLEADLQKTTGRSIVFVHQRLDVEGHYGIRNAVAVRRVLEKTGSVMAVFQGHNHLNEHRQLEGIHYVTLAAMVEGSGAQNSGYSLLDVHANGLLTLEGFRQHTDRQLEATSSTRKR
ncbi:MAG: metallophosphoesterase family protein [Planctomycetota bacterium]|nr:metallophosphoesterase family protein [Planctomycetota bacterium]